MTSRVFSRRFLPAAAVQAHAGAYSETAQSLVGRPRFAWEMGLGGSAVAGELPLVESNPQGQTGADMSGPPFGAAMLLPVWTWAGQGDSGVSRANYLSAVATTVARLPVFRLWNRPHAVRPDGLAPLQQLALSWRASASAGTSSVLSLSFRNLNTGTETTITRTINTTTNTAYVETTLVPMAPGANVFEFRARVTSGTRVFNVRNLMLSVTAKRRHDLSFPG